MGRPSKQRPTLAVVVDGDVLTWTDGHLSSTSETLAQRARFLAAIKAPLLSPVNIAPVVAEIDDPENRQAALVTMLNVAPGRAIVWEADDPTLEALRTHRSALGAS